MYTSFLATLLLAAVGSQAIKVESPSRDTVWQSGLSAQTVSWEAVSTDATSFAIQLVNQAGFLTDSPVTLIANQSTGTANQVNSVTVTYPNGNWPVGTAFQINLVSSSTSGNAAILAQSNQFNITSGGSSGSSSTSSTSGTAPSTISMSRSSSSPSSTVPAVTAGPNATGGTASSSGAGLPNAVTSTGSADAAFGTPSAFVGLLMAAAALMGVSF